MKWDPTPSGPGRQFATDAEADDQAADAEVGEGRLESSGTGGAQAQAVEHAQDQVDRGGCLRFAVPPRGTHSPLPGREPPMRAGPVTVAAFTPANTSGVFGCEKVGARAGVSDLLCASPRLPQ